MKNGGFDAPPPPAQKGIVYVVVFATLNLGAFPASKKNCLFDPFPFFFD